MPIVLLHGLTATRRYVVMGSRALQRSGHRVDRLRRARSWALLAGARAERLRLRAARGGSRGGARRARASSAPCWRAPRWARTRPLASRWPRPSGWPALVLITPSFDPARRARTSELARWDALARGLREGGVEGFVAAYDLDEVPEAWRATVETVLRQRLAAHEHPLAVADALEAVPRSRPFEQPRASWPRSRMPARRRRQPRRGRSGPPAGRRRALGRAIPGARLRRRGAGPPARSPIAWQGGQLSRVDRRARRPRPYVITYRCMSEYALSGTAAATTGSPARWRRSGWTCWRGCALAGRRDRARRRLRLGARHAGADRSACRAGT